MIAPQSLMAPSDEATVKQVIASSAIRSKYAAMVDRESAYEKLQARLQAAPTPEEAPAPAPRAEAPAKAPRAAKEEPSMVEQVVKSTAFKSMIRSAGTVIGREITRSIFGTARRSR
jgi:hypothetical protein